MTSFFLLFVVVERERIRARAGAVGRFHPITPFNLLLEEQTILRSNRNFIFQILFGNCEQDFYFEKRVRIGIVFIRL